MAEKAKKKVESTPAQQKKDREDAAKTRKKTHEKRRKEFEALK